MVWYRSNSGEKTHPIGTKTPNVWGLYDMHGNVSEWCDDWMANYPSVKASDPHGPLYGDYRVVRGGCWYDGSGSCTSSFRDCYAPHLAYKYVGFRCVINPNSADSSNSISKNQSENVSIDMLDKKVNNGKNAGERRVISFNGVEFAFRWCPAGTFTMGSEGYYDENPHQVTLSKGFWMMETEVTQKQWRAVMGNAPSEFKGDNLPVENVSWNDCQEFCKKCSELGLSLQLPTEAQWEYACRAGIFGNREDKLDTIAWYSNNSYKETSPVGKKKPNEWGLYDMLGNVREWCADFKGPYPYGNITDPTGPEKGINRVTRGGSWYSYSSSCRVAVRNSDEPNLRNDTLGFRCIINPE